MESDDRPKYEAARERSIEEEAIGAIWGSFEKLAEIKKLAVIQGKRQLLATAIQNCEYNSFQCLPEGGHWRTNTVVPSTGFARQVLFAFQRGQGHPLGSATVPGILNVEEAKKNFRQKICLQIEELGLKTILKQEADGTFVVYYSEE
jgi:hypothetical protein